VDALAEALCAIGAPVNGAAALRVRSRAPNRAAYLARPDWGRRLLAASATELADSSAAAAIVPDLVFVIADGLSAIAVQAHAPPLLQALMPLLPGHLRCGPPVIAEQARVALGDEIGALLKARCVVVLIGERPGLSAPDSLGIYVTWAPVVGRNDAERNCISNVRPGGLVPAEAAQALAELLAEIFTDGKSGVLLALAEGFTTKLDPSLSGAE
jgi:ethanolamine ammonia-lyase small subunit